MNQIPVVWGFVWDGKVTRIMCHLEKYMKKFQEDRCLLFIIEKDRKFFQVVNVKFSLIPYRYGIYDELFDPIFLLETPKPPIMITEDLEKLTLHELCDLLLEHTILLLDSMEKKADGITLRDQKKNVELLQEVIQEKRKTDGSP